MPHESGDGDERQPHPFARELSRVVSENQLLPNSDDVDADPAWFARFNLLQVEDYTDFRDYFVLLESTFLTTIDSLLWTAVNIGVLLLFVVTTPFTYFIVRPVVNNWRKHREERIDKQRARALNNRLQHDQSRTTQFTSERDRSQPPGRIEPQLTARIDERPRRNSLGIRVPGSLVCAGSPDFHYDYARKLNPQPEQDGGNSFVNTTVIERVRKAKEFDFDLAEFFLHLSALVYEPNETVMKVLRNYGSGIKATRFGRPGCIIMAAYSTDPEMNFVVLVFKGTSPLDLTEWLTDFSIRKSVGKNSVMPGLVHTGFAAGFGFPPTDLPKAKGVMVPITTDPRNPLLKLNPRSHKHRKYVRLEDLEQFYRRAITSDNAPRFAPDHLDLGIEDVRGVDARREGETQFWMKIIYPQLLAIRSEFGTRRPHLWITGHSLGAATATIFTASMLWHSYTIAGQRSLVQNINWAQDFILRGAYTYGTPRTGDSSYREAIEFFIQPPLAVRAARIELIKEAVSKEPEIKPDVPDFYKYEKVAHILIGRYDPHVNEAEPFQGERAKKVRKTYRLIKGAMLRRFKQKAELERVPASLRDLASVTCQLKLENDAEEKDLRGLVIGQIRDIISDPPQATTPNAVSPSKRFFDSKLPDDFQFYRIINANDIVCSVPGGSIPEFGQWIRNRKFRPFFGKCRPSSRKEILDEGSNAFDTAGNQEEESIEADCEAIQQEERDAQLADDGIVDKFVGVTLTDFQFLGNPVKLGFRDGKLLYEERSQRDFLRTMFRETFTGLRDLKDLSNGTTLTKEATLMIVACSATFGIVGWLKDHAPSEYLMNLQKARARIEKKDDDRKKEEERRKEEAIRKEE